MIIIMAKKTIIKSSSFPVLPDYLKVGKVGRDYSGDFRCV